MKKFVSMALASVMALGLTASFGACGDDDKISFKPVNAEDIKIGMIALHDDTSTYDKNFIDAMKQAVREMGLNVDTQLKLATGIEETEACYNKAKEFASQGCQVVFADSFGHEDYMIQAAKKYPKVRFAHATGTKAHSLKRDNFGNAFASIYEGRYLAGIAAGMKLNELGNGSVNASDYVIGYVGAFPYEEVVSGYTSFYLGAKSVCSLATMKVRYTGSWFDPEAEESAARTLIDTDGCKLISQHADSYGAPTACQDKGVPNVSYNGSTESVGTTTYIISSRINWVPYFKYMIQCVLDGDTLAYDWVGTLKNGAVEVLTPSSNAAAGTAEAINAAKAQLIAGTLNVFDTSKFTVGGVALADGTKADVDSDAKYTPDTVVVKNGIFEESKYRSAPYFGVRIDGITELQEN